MKLVRGNLEDEIDALFRLPLAEFTGARNALAARLKKSGREEEKAEAARVKALAKPSISAWAVNQLYWNHREAFDWLLASGERFDKSPDISFFGEGRRYAYRLGRGDATRLRTSDLATYCYGMPATTRHSMILRTGVLLRMLD